MKYKVLMVDDDHAQHEIAGDYLEMAGYDVIHAFNGKEGLSSVADQKPDIILLDIRMPEMDGFQTLSKLQSISEFRDIPVLFLSSLNQPNLKVKGLELGADDYITKPFNKAELFARLRVALRRTARYKRNISTMDGNLKDFAISELLQTFDISGSNVYIEFSEMNASVAIDKGEILSVVLGDFSGFDALIRMMILNKGIFTVKFGLSKPGVDQSPMSIQGAIMDAVTTMDEMYRILSKVALPEDTVVITGELPEESVFKTAKALGPVTFKELICIAAGDVKQNAEIIALLNSEHKIEVIS